MADGTAHYAEKVDDTQQFTKVLSVYIIIFRLLGGTLCFHRMYLATTLHGQDMMQGQFFKRNLIKFEFRVFYLSDWLPNQD